MPNYNEAIVSGQEWQRARLVQISNEHGGQSSITFVEERVAQLDGGRVIHTDVGQITEPFTQANQGTVFELLHPETGTPLGQQATYTQVYVLLHSLYLHLAAQRDNAAV